MPGTFARATAHDERRRLPDRHLAAQICGSRTTTSLQHFLDSLDFDANEAADVGHAFTALIDHGFDQLALPARGDTLARWHALAAVAARDLSLVKLFEGHTDALAILDELDGPSAPAQSRWGVWAAEPPGAKVVASTTGGTRLRLNGTKAWCSGADIVTHALITAWRDGEPVLAAVDMHQPRSISLDASRWQAVGMRAVVSGDVRFDGASAVQIGTSGDYTRRPGFWQGGAGIAACWFGAAARLAHHVRQAVATHADPYRLAHLGDIDVALSGAAALLRETAACIDAHPAADIKREALRARLVVEAAANVVMMCAGRALGAGPLCTDTGFARAMADLPVFLRQSHAERDLAALGETLTGTSCAEQHLWTLGTSDIPDGIV